MTRLKAKPDCESCRKTLAVYNEVPDCATCLPDISPENMPVLKIFSIVKGILFTAPAEAFRIISRYIKDHDEQERCFNLLRTAATIERDD